MEHASPVRLELGQLLSATMQAMVRSPFVTALVVGVGAALDTWLSFADLDFVYLVSASMTASFVAGFVLLRSILRTSGLNTGSIIHDFAGCLTLYVVTTMAIAFGLVLLVIPGMVLAVRWTPALAIYMNEPIGMRETLRRSWAMTDGSEWPIFTAMLITIAIPIILAIVLPSAGVNTDPSAGGAYSIAWLVVESLTFACSSVLLWTLSASTCLLLRNDTEALAETFA
jgi:hypothetical protein